METQWTVLTALAMVVGLFGTLVPILPGLMLIWGLTVLYGFLIGEFGTIGIAIVIFQTVIVIVSVAKGFVVPKKASDAYGTSGAAQIAALIGAIIGFFAIPVVGLPVGALAGVLAVEYTKHKTFAAAWQATKGVLVGFGINGLIDFVLGWVMIGAWAIWAATVHI